MDLALQLPVNRPFRWRLFFIIWAACIFGTIAILPYALTLQGGSGALANLPISLPLTLAISIAQNAVLFAIAAGVGLLLATRIGLGFPFLEAWLDGNPMWGKLPRVALLAAVLGIAGSVVVILLDATVFASAMKDAVTQAGIDTASETLQPAWWKGFLASFYGGIAEEVLLRLFMMSLLAWLGRFIGRTADNRPALWVLWTANILAAVLFGLGHLPAAVSMGIPMTPIFILRTVLLNGVVGVICGWLYFTRGLESSMISHFSADIVLHVLTPLFA